MILPVRFRTSSAQRSADESPCGCIIENEAHGMLPWALPALNSHTTVHKHAFYNFYSHTKVCNGNYEVRFIKWATYCIPV